MSFVRLFELTNSASMFGRMHENESFANSRDSGVASSMLSTGKMQSELFKSNTDVLGSDRKATCWPLALVLLLL